MAAIDFPAGPSVGQAFTAGNGVTYTWNGLLWVASGASAGGDFCATSPGGTIGASLAVIIPATVITGNSGGWYSNSTGRYSPPAGRYAICGTISGFNAGAVVGPQLQLRKNGTAIVTSATSSTAGNVCEAVVSGTFDANGTDFFDLAASSGTTVTYFGSGAVFSAFPISGIKGPPGDYPSGLKLYDEQVLSSASAGINVTCPVNAKVVEIHFDLGTNLGANDGLLFSLMQGATVVSGATYNMQTHRATGGTVSGAVYFNLTSWSFASGVYWQGVLRSIQTTPTVLPYPMMTGQIYHTRDRRRPYCRDMGRRSRQHLAEHRDRLSLCI